MSTYTLSRVALSWFSISWICIYKSATPKSLPWLSASFQYGQHASSVQCLHLSCFICKCTQWILLAACEFDSMVTSHSIHITPLKSTSLPPLILYYLSTGIKTIKLSAGQVLIQEPPTDNKFTHQHAHPTVNKYTVSGSNYLRQHPPSWYKSPERW